MRITRAILRRPGQSVLSGLSTTSKDVPIYKKALHQHAGYAKALTECGAEIQVFEPIERYPDSTFIEDVAVLTPYCAILTSPGAESRKGEVTSIEPVIKSLFATIERISAPGTLDGGDILNIENHYYIGLSKRTNRSGAEQFIAILEKHGMSGSTIPVREVLHLKTGVTWLGGRILVATKEFSGHPAFSGFDIITVPPEESGAADCIAINGKIMMPAGFPKTYNRLTKLGQEIIEVDISEFAKIDGGLTCLSLRF